MVSIKFLLEPLHVCDIKPEVNCFLIVLANKWQNWLKVMGVIVNIFYVYPLVLHPIIIHNI